MNFRAYFEGRWKGLKIGSLGVAISFVGFLSFQCGIIPLSAAIFMVGWLVTIGGMIIHFRQFVRENSESRESRYPIAKQPWEP